VNKCGYKGVKIRFGPEVVCPSVETFYAVSPPYTVGCDIFAHPPVHPDQIVWSLVAPGRRGAVRGGDAPMTSSHSGLKCGNFETK
jgi:hypothetical protein